MIGLPDEDLVAWERERDAERELVKKLRIDSRSGTYGSLAPPTLKYFKPNLKFLRAPKQQPVKLIDISPTFVRAKPANCTKRKENLETAAKARLQAMKAVAVAVSEVEIKEVGL